MIQHTSPPLWGIRLTVEDAAAGPFEDALADFALSVARFEAKGAREGAPKLWRLQALCEAEPEIAALAVQLAVAAGRAGVEMPDFHVERLPDRDWLAFNRSQFPPITAARFFIHGAHFGGRPPADKLVLKLDAGPAFGSGTHETTRGCLIAIDEILAIDEIPEGPPPLRNALDLGCGSGILALAIARAAGIPVLASDVDGIAAATAQANARDNGLAHLVTAVTETGVGEAVRASAPYDLIVANILAEPLIGLAHAVGEVLARGGRLVLSGLLGRQEPEVMAAYGREGFSRARAIMLGDWCTLVLEGPSGP